MALEGKIKDFGVSDIIQLVSQQQKTGILFVERGIEKAEIYFVDGQVTESRHFENIKRNPLGEIFVNAELISEENLNSALRKQQSSYEHLGQILIRDGLIGKKHLEKAILTQIYETMYAVLQWNNGSYRFISKTLSIDPGMAPTPNLESILLDVLRMIDEWPVIKETITTFDLVFAKAEDNSPNKLDSEELLVYKLVNGKNSVKKIIARTLSDRFSVCKILAELFQQGCIRLTSAQPEKKHSVHLPSFQKAVGFISYAGLAVTVFFLFLLPVQISNSFLPLLNPQELNEPFLQECFENISVKKLEKALEVFLFRNGRYPESTDKLASQGVLRESDLEEFKKKEIVYSLKGNTYLIETKSSLNTLPLKTRQ